MEDFLSGWEPCDAVFTAYHDVFRTLEAEAQAYWPLVRALRLSTSTQDRDRDPHSEVSVRNIVSRRNLGESLGRFEDRLDLLLF